MASIRVLLFARYADLLGLESLELDLERVPTVSAVIAHLRSLPAGGFLPERPFVAVNLAQVSEDAALRPGDEVALLPPMAGG